MTDQQPKRLRKSADNEVIDGVCGGIGEYFGIDPVLIRLLFVVGTFAGFGSFILIYLVLMIVMPDAPEAPKGHGRQKRSAQVEVPVQDREKRKNDELHLARPLDEVEKMKRKYKDSN
ncbi:MAG: PspC domain-containing protein [Chloroflexota bacterium]